VRGRGVSIAAVILLHVVFVVALLRAFVMTAPEKVAPSEREVVLPLSLPMLGHASQAPNKGAERRGIAVTIPDFSHSIFVSPGAAGEKLGTALFGCTPEKMATLPREEREKCERQTGFNYSAFASLPMKLAPPPEKFSNADIDARIRNTVDLCMAAKATGTECIDTIIYGKRLP